MEKFCVFCGNKPSGKNLEHIIPKWLINLTGDPNRTIRVGPVWDPKNNSLSELKLSFSQFAFPSCKKCNDEFSSMEGLTNKIIQGILLDLPTSAAEFSELLSWFDKVRIGLWLAFHYLQKNHYYIEPHFYIKSRMDLIDRALIIYKSDYIGKRLNFAGPSLPAFQINPTCFCLIINNYFFVNISTRFLVSRGLGLPYSTEQFYTEEKDILFHIRSGRGIISHPIISNQIFLKGSRIFQPIAEPNLLDLGYYNSDYDKNLFDGNKSGIGKIFIENNSKQGNYFYLNDSDWIPKLIEDDNSLLRLTAKEVLEFQISELNNVKYGSISEAKKNIIKDQNEIAKYANRSLIKIINA